jgi:hypothetical protein
MKRHRDMIAAVRGCVLAAFILLCSQKTWSQKSETVTLAEPAVIDVASLFKQADTVALVKVVSGDAEQYSVAIYKGEVMKSFKGSPAGTSIYFGPYLGQRLGWEYLLFLRNTNKPIAPKTTSASAYGTIQFAEVFDQGYSSMMTSYECVFGGKAVTEQCDYGVRVCTDYIRIPKSIRTYPPAGDTPGCRWVKKQAFMSFLNSLSHLK